MNGARSSVPSESSTAAVGLARDAGYDAEPGWSFTGATLEQYNRCHSYTMIMDYKQILTLEPGKRSGKPCIRGMRITVYEVLSYLAAGMTHEEILSDFPYLTQEDILACLSYAADREKQSLIAA